MNAPAHDFSSAKAQFREEGYCVISDVLSLDECAHAPMRSGGFERRQRMALPSRTLTEFSMRMHNE